MTVAVNPTPTPPLADCRRAVASRLARVRRRLRGQLLVEGIAWGVGTAVFLTALSLALDRLVRPDLTVRLVLLALGAIVFAAVAVHRLRRPGTPRPDGPDLAELLDRRQRGLGHRLTSVLQLPRLLEQDPSASPAMIHAAVEENFAALENVDLQATFNSNRRRNVWLLLTGLVLLVAAFCIV